MDATSCFHSGVDELYLCFRHELNHRVGHPSSRLPRHKSQPHTYAPKPFHRFTTQLPNCDPCIRAMLVISESFQTSLLIFAECPLSQAEICFERTHTHTRLTSCNFGFPLLHLLHVPLRRSKCQCGVHRLPAGLQHPPDLLPDRGLAVRLRQRAIGIAPLHIQVVHGRHIADEEVHLTGEAGVELLEVFLARDALPCATPPPPPPPLPLCMADDSSSCPRVRLRTVSTRGANGRHVDVHVTHTNSLHKRQFLSPSLVRHTTQTVRHEAWQHVTWDNKSFKDRRRASLSAAEGMAGQAGTRRTTSSMTLGETEVALSASARLSTAAAQLH